ncbi:MAG: flagellar basal-body MS-ring/collar protein FliF [Armatimonadota bacterium]|nr:flagellar M-ring protein FliF [bacterium]
MDKITKSGPLAALAKLWGDLNSTQRVVVIAFVTLAVALMLLVGMTATKPRMSVLFSGLAQEDAGTIVQKLGEQKVPYKLSADGTTIEVPDNKVYDLRLQLATQGLPQGGSVGFELFDKTNFGMTEFTEKVTYQRAITGTLTRTLCHLDPVRDAKVLLTMPEQKIYSSEQEPAKASVVLKLRRGMPLTDEQVGGVVHLVSSAVEGLIPSNVTVLDTDGNVLSEGAGSGGNSLMTANQTKMKRQFETELSQNIQSMLAKIVGTDKAVVRVSADMSFDQTQTKSEEYQPAGSGQAVNAEAKGVLLSEDKSSETYAGGVLPPGGVPAANRSNNSTGSASDSYNRTQTTAQYQVTKRIQEVVTAPGKLQRLSVAVLVDDKVEPTKVAAITEAVTAAAGIDQKRGDQVTVQRVGFDTASSKAVEADMAKAAKTEMIMAIAKNAGAALLLIVFLVFLTKIIKQIKVQVPADEPVVDVAADVDQAGMTLPNPAALFDSQTLAQSPVPQQPAEPFSTARPQGDELPPEITQSSPEELARLVRNWMTE